MTNKQNLKPVRTKSEARERGKNGGIASGKVRREKKAIRELLQIAMTTPNRKGKLTQIETLDDLKDATLTMGQAWAFTMMRKAMNGDIQASVFVRDTIGENPATQLQIEHKPDIEKAAKEIAEYIENVKQKNAERDRIIAEECSQSTIDKLKALH